MAKKNKTAKTLAIAKQALQVAMSAKSTRSRNAVRGQSASMQGGARSRRDPRLAKEKSTASALAQYEAALMNPFSEQALGARVPDSYSFPSEVRHAKTVYTLQAATGGNLDCAIFPHPLYTVVSGIGTLNGGVGTPENTVPGFTQTGIVSQTTLAGIYGNYRIVGGGVRVKFSQSYNNATGRLFIAVQPSPANIPYYAGSGAKVDLYDTLDLPYEAASGGIPTSIVTLPYSLEIPVSELIGNGIEIPLRVSSAAFSEWREANIASSGPSLVTLGASTSAIGEIVGENFVAADGFSTVMIRGTNLPTGSPCLDIEVILHFEGTPAIQTGTVMAGATSAPVVNVTGMFAALAKQNNSPFAKKIGSVVGAVVKTGLRNTTVGRMARVLGFANP